jgi:NADPH2:quinone reductase
VGQAVLVHARELPVRGGCYAEKIAVPADTLHLLPEDTDLDAAAGLGNFQVAWSLLNDSTRGFEPKSVLITGAAGGVGGAVAQLARHMGMLVIGTISSDEKAAFARDQGADHLINYKTENVIERVKELTGGRGVDLVLDHVAGPRFQDNVEMLAPWGTVVSFGDLEGPPTSDIYAAIRANAGKCLGVRWFSIHVYDGDRDGRRRIVGELIKLFAAGAIRPRVAARLALADAADAQLMVEGGKALGRVILKP